jgi:hypothetical protein
LIGTSAAPQEKLHRIANNTMNCACRFISIAQSVGQLPLADHESQGHFSSHSSVPAGGQPATIRAKPPQPLSWSGFSVLRRRLTATELLCQLNYGKEKTAGTFSYPASEESRPIHRLQKARSFASGWEC